MKLFFGGLLIVIGAALGVGVTGWIWLQQSEIEDLYAKTDRLNVGWREANAQVVKLQRFVLDSECRQDALHVIDCRWMLDLECPDQIATAPRWTALLLATTPQNAVE